MSAVDIVREGRRNKASEEPRMTKRALANLTTLVSEVRAAVSRLGPRGASALDILHEADAVPALRDLFYELNAESPDDIMPIRKTLGDWQLVTTCIIPILRAVHSDPAAQSEPRRWAPTVYHALRLLSILTVPIDPSNVVLRPGCNLEVQLMDVKQAFASEPYALEAIVALLQHYMQRKAEKLAEFKPAEDSKIEDARVDNILRFFRNLLSPPRPNVERSLLQLDTGIHLSLVGTMAKTDVFSTLTVFFASKEDASNQYTNIVMIVSEIYALAFRQLPASQIAGVAGTRPGPLRTLVPRHSEARAPQCMERDIRVSTENLMAGQGSSKENSAAASNQTGSESVDTECNGQQSAQPITTGKIPGGFSCSSKLRAALQQERCTLGGSRSVVASSRWGNRFSGAFQVISHDRKATQGNEQAPKNLQTLRSEGQNALCIDTFRTVSGSRSMTTKRIVPARALTLSSSSRSKACLKNGLQLNSEVFCVLGAKNRSKITLSNGKCQISRGARADLLQQGIHALNLVMCELIQECFTYLIAELRSRISDLKDRGSGEESWRGRRTYAALVAHVVAFQREAMRSREHHLVSNKTVTHSHSMQHVPMQAALGGKVKGTVEWKPVESAICLESFKLVFASVLEAREDKSLKEELELATAAIKEMMKLLQCMSSDDRVTVYQAVETSQSYPAAKMTPNIAGEKSCDGSQQLAQRLSSQNAGNSEDFSLEPVPMQSQSPTVPASLSLNPLSPRELALNTLEELFEKEEYLEAPAMLAKVFDPRVHSFRHLANTIEIAYTFTTILLESEFAYITVSRKSRKRAARQCSRGNRRKCRRVGDESDGSSESDEHAQASLKSLEGGHITSQDEKPEQNTSVELKQGLSDVSGLPEVANATANDRSTLAQEQGQYSLLANESLLQEDDDPSASKRSHIPCPADLEGTEEANKEEFDIRTNTPDNHFPERSIDENEFVQSEIESSEVIRRFAHPKALQHISFALRAAFCNCTGLSGSILPMPDGSSDLFNLGIVAKSLAVLQAVWRVSGLRERGALRGAFFNISLLHLLSLSVIARDKVQCCPESILGTLALFGCEVIQAYFAVLSRSPALLMDSLFFPDRSTQRSHAKRLHQRCVNRMSQSNSEQDSADEYGSSDDCDLSLPV